ncbi:TIGR00730 family Rossman fold protein [Rubritalea marina]|uniref:LOG family protein n=1 Tax=Rubritalea marina TaxID=361055 RepID=UPI0003608A5A|nr:TIGR00730 family Rossman fold protein [Rubritalea marina]
MSKKKHVRVPQEKDFTGGEILAASCNYIGSTGDPKVDEQVMQLSQAVGTDQNVCLIAEMITTALRLGRESISMGDFKLMNRALKEMAESSRVYHPFRFEKKVGIFGSARTKPDEPEYQTTVQFARRIVEEGFMTITGAGPGIMAAGNEGAGRENTFGLDISLPFETSANPFINGDEKLIEFNYFFTRKLAFVKEADAAVAMPGGVGTMDEIFEALTLIQTGKSTVYPLVLLDCKGGTYWKFWLQFMEEHLMRLKLISESDFSLFKVTDDVEEAVQEIVQFYKNFHSYRYVGDQLVVRMHQALSKKAFAKLSEDFADIVSAGKMRQNGALKAEMNEKELLDLPRIVLRHGRNDFGRLREFIDAINLAEVETDN